ncbi:glycosyltransferase [Skermania piniformis]|uniref:Glycosyltransferase n=1 Tax=Skermania pinensis TaxID=39122 RepID=A0ABX8SBH8_9ACTN|nr:glycosyltransferase [Skermania piniformis]QXQ15219.1 glycosyltransferase [Skermania piniformis]
MQILHAVTLISPDAAYGGPVQVALNQAVALRRLGHQVQVAAGVRGYRVPPTEQQGVPLVTAPARFIAPGLGFASLAAPALLRRVSWSELDLVHLHLARDLVMLPLAAAVLRYRLPYVVQPHGMLVARSNPLAPMLDLALVRRVLRGARAVFHLTEGERDALTEVAGPGLRLVALPNGVPEYRSVEPGPAESVPEVLYLARLQERKRPLDFVDAGIALLDAGVRARFTLVGPDEGEGGTVGRRIAGHAGIRWTGPVPAGAGPARMRRASVFVLPAVDEPYPMAVLEAMAVGLPVVLTTGCDLADFVRDTRSGVVVEPKVAALTTAIGDLLADPAEARAAGERGRSAVRDLLGMPTVARRLDGVYRAAQTAAVGGRPISVGPRR